MKTAASSLAGYQKALEAGAEPKTLRAAFLRGMRATVEILTDLYQCPTCVDRVNELVKEMEALARQNDAGN